MIKTYALLDSDNYVVTFYRDDVHSIIPEGTVEISEKLWQEILELLNSNNKVQLKSKRTKDNLSIKDFAITEIELTEEQKIQIEIQELEQQLESTSKEVMLMWEKEQLGLEIDVTNRTNLLQARQLIRNKLDELKELIKNVNI